MKKTEFLIVLSAIAALALASCGDDSSSGPEGDSSEELSSEETSSDAGSSEGGSSEAGNSQGGNSQGGNSQGGNSSEQFSSSSEDEGDLVWTPVPLQSEITMALPMTGLVLWEDNGKTSAYKNSIALEYA